MDLSKDIQIHFVKIQVDGCFHRQEVNDNSVFWLFNFKYKTSSFVICRVYVVVHLILSCMQRMVF